LIQTAKIQQFPLVLVGVDYWEPLVEFLRGRLLTNATISPADLDLLLITDSIDDLLGFVKDRAMRQFGLTYGAGARPRPALAGVGAG
jgi:predicted Rossmann-fold nucleotide-binding protein